MTDIRSARKLNPRDKKQYSENDLEAAFNLSRDKLYNHNKTFRGYRFADFLQFLYYMEQMKNLAKKQKT